MNDQAIAHSALATNGYHCIVQLPIQWGDQDAFGHVNNTVPIRWFETARIAYLMQTGIERLLDKLELGPILASMRCEYRRQLQFPDTVWVGAKITRLGRSSLTMDHAIYSTTWGEQVATEGKSVVVVFDYKANRPRAIPADMLTVVDEFEGYSVPRARRTDDE